ncbi:hypothetical protein C7B82_15460 [Stenomitos frigidus ULC18]|uniref:Uncharacterized protein n=1 Tax=Stenomitos frigidus ULC18 TaxID=2107698 RepID=A0A2T1E4V9_9CYAN|nr:hypothetical protein C7B82_15460 [Stenomitos frigidus ULC18]
MFNAESTCLRGALSSTWLRFGASVTHCFESFAELVGNALKPKGMFGGCFQKSRGSEGLADLKSLR